MKRILSMILALCMVFALCACGNSSAPAQQTTAPAADSAAADTAAAAPEIKFTISTDAANRTQYCELFVKNLEEASNGRIKGEVLAANSLGSCNDMCQMLQLGTLDIMLSDDMSVDSNLNGALGFAWLPGLVADYDEADQYYNFGWIAEKVGEIMLENNLVRMSSFCNGFRQVGNVVRPITEMSDLAGLKIRTPSVSSIVDFYEMCGALPVMIAGSEVLSALQTGTVDGLDNSVYNYINQGVTDVVKYICELNYCYAGGCFIAGTPFWSTLSAEDQELSGSSLSPPKRCRQLSRRSTPRSGKAPARPTVTRSWTSSSAASTRNCPTSNKQSDDSREGLGVYSSNPSYRIL